MERDTTTWADVGRALRLAGLFGLLSGAVWWLGAGWRGALLGVIGAAAVMGIFILSRLFSLRVALLVATLAVFVLLMFGTSSWSGQWPD